MTALLEKRFDTADGLLAFELSGEGRFEFPKSYRLNALANDDFAFAILPKQGELEASVRLLSEDNSVIQDLFPLNHEIVTLNTAIKSIEVSVFNDAPFFITAGLITRLQNIRENPFGFMRCEACIQSLKAMVVAILGPLAFIGDIPDELIEALLDAEFVGRIIEILGLQEQEVIELIQGIRMFGLDNLAQNLCEASGMCQGLIHL